MPWGTVKLRPGVVTQWTPVLNETGVSQSNLIRYHDGLVQKLGGWEKYYSGTISSTIREIHGWAALLGTEFLGVGATGTSTLGSSASAGALSVITSGSLSDITPQTYTTNPAPNFSISSGSNVVTVIDAGSSTSVFDTVFFNTQLAIGNMLLAGAYHINTVGGSSTYTIRSSVVASTTIVSSGILPVFNTTANSAVVTVTLPNNNYSATPNLYQNFIAPSSVGGNITIEGPYQINTVIDSTQFTIIAPTEATSTSTTTMNSGNAQLVYYEGIGPPAAGFGYGVGGYGLGGYGIGTSSGGGTGGGTPITATDWTMDNWGSILLACPTDGPIYAWAGDGGFTTATVVPTAPFFNGGLYISQPQQILVAWRSCQTTGVQDPMKLRWSDAGDYTVWDVTSQTAAGSFTIPVGSRIIGGIQAGLRGIIWTDTDVWLQQYVGLPVVFNHTRVGTGCGLIGPHAAGVANDRVYWCGNNNIFVLDNKGVDTVPCSVWDFLFQNLNETYKERIRCAVNSMFNEISWYFPSSASTGENDSYIKLNLKEGSWDYGSLQRTAWNNVSALGNPIGTTTTQIYQHEITNDNDGTPISPSFETGYFTIAEGERLSFVDYVVPDMKFGTYGSSGASCEMTIRAVDYPGEEPRTYGPVIFTSTTQYLNPRLRGRFMSLSVTSNDLGSFWRIGGIKYRYAPAGRR